MLKLTAKFRIMFRDERGMTHPTGEILKITRFQNPRETENATLIKAARDATRQCENGQRPKLIGFKLV